MLRLLLPTGALLIACFPVSAQVNQITIERPFLWEFKQPGSDTSSWLFGTIHVNDPNITRLHPQVQSAFDSSTEAWFEIDFANDATAQTQAISLPKGRFLDDVLPPRLITRIDERLQKLSPLLTRGSLPEFHVVIWPLILANLEAQVRYLGTAPLDLQLQQAARQAGKTTGGLEDPVQQLKPLTQLPLSEQVAFLQASLDVMDVDDAGNRRQLDRLIRLYASGNEQELVTFLDEELHRPKISDTLQEKIVETLLIQRNHQMAQAIHEKQQARQDAVLFIAVGTAHLVGEKSIPAVLTDLGYTVKRPAPAAVAPQDKRTPGNLD